MKNCKLMIFPFLFAAVISCGGKQKASDDADAVIKTQYGDIKIILYEKTEEHRINFEKLVKENFYDGLLFHRVIQNFMIQGGDPNSKNAAPGVTLGGGSLDYTLPAEINFPEHYHKRGVLAAARRGGPSNPEKRSSASQFYIIQGKIFSDGALDTLEMAKNQNLINELMRKNLTEIQDELEQFRKDNNQEGFNVRISEVREQVDNMIETGGLSFKFTAEQRQIYTTVGGYPSLDGDYTVFGEVVEGLEVVDKIASVETDNNDRPVVDEKMQIIWLK